MMGQQAPADTTVYWNIQTDRYHKSEDCAGDENSVMETELGACRYDDRMACERCNTHKL